ncbi:helix-turn-helix transcriptional regulator [uncultured Dysosmobacter sp.]|uniref:helix-turn-helix domain-containing protein n=1 Tax=uncultured Dysosmobacter sp. TaxID=2591384 RepID=UPI002623C44B|nr:helix-turn-helix domain-containing protein [uncultured Dysosmobacter sp.]
MPVSYNKLWKLLIDKDMSKTELTHKAGLTTNVMARLGRNEDVRLLSLEKICAVLDCTLNDIVEIVPESQRQSLQRLSFTSTVHNSNEYLFRSAPGSSSRGYCCH